MGIQIKKDEKTFKYERAGAEIYFRFIPGKVRDRIVKQNTKRGIVDGMGILRDELAYAIVGWKNIMDGDQQVEFDAELISSLPDEDQIGVQDLLAGDPSKCVEVQLGN